MAEPFANGGVAPAFMNAVLLMLSGAFVGAPCALTTVGAVPDPTKQAVTAMIQRRLDRIAASLFHVGMATIVR
jgi:hypothetical protein